MKILVLNASPKGKNSTTVHTALYLQGLHPEHTFTVLPVGQRIKHYEKEFGPLRSALEQAEQGIPVLRHGDQPQMLHFDDGHQRFTTFSTINCAA